VLLQMAQVWQHLADQHEQRTLRLFEPHEGERPVLQRQQQIPPDGDRE